jgi:hypothetical protein
MSGCVLNSGFMLVTPTPTLDELVKLTLSGTVGSGMDVATLKTADNKLHVIANASVLGLAQGWTSAEFNILGDCCGSTAYFNSKFALPKEANLVLRLDVDNGTTNAPICAKTSLFSTTETNNLNRGTCEASGGASPAIVFTQTGGGPLGAGLSFGDTHLTTFFGVHYDFQGAGEFVLVQADPGLVVQTRQKPWTPSSVSTNTGVATKMGDTRVAVCLVAINGVNTPLMEVNGVNTSLKSGESRSLSPDGVMVSRTGDVYLVSRPSGAQVKAETFPNGVINVSVELGATNTKTVRGLLGGDEALNLIRGDGKVVKAPPISGDDFRKYLETWRVDPADSLLCSDGKVLPGMPSQSIYASDLPPEEQERVKKICTRAGVQIGPVLDDCMLDVSLLGDDSAANVFKNAPVPVSVIRPSP